MAISFLFFEPSRGPKKTDYARGAPSLVPIEKSNLPDHTTDVGVAVNLIDLLTLLAGEQAPPLILLDLCHLLSAL
jgi:hypothetical protein